MLHRELDLGNQLNLLRNGIRGGGVDVDMEMEMEMEMDIITHAAAEGSDGDLRGLAA